MSRVVLVDEHDQETGEMDKMEAHLKGKLHRAFSVLLFNRRGELLVQQRAAGKYHSAGLWTNTCCSHPLPGESVMAAARRRLHEEMGVESKIRFQFKFMYRVQLNEGLIEHEYDHVLTGLYDGQPKPNHMEVQSWKYIDAGALRNEMIAHPENFTYWFRRMLNHPRMKLSSGG